MKRNHRKMQKTYQSNIATIREILLSPFGCIILGLVLIVSTMFVGNVYYSIGVWAFCIIGLLILRYLAYKDNPDMMSALNKEVQRQHNKEK